MKRKRRKLSHVSRDWRDDSATLRQLELLDANNIRYDSDITRGEASDLITDAQYDDHPFSEDAFTF